MIALENEETWQDVADGKPIDRDLPLPAQIVLLAYRVKLLLDEHVCDRGVNTALGAAAMDLGFALQKAMKARYRGPDWGMT